MNVILQNKFISLLRFDKDEDVFAELSSYAEKEQIRAATFSAIGASSEITLSYYDLENKIYLDHDLKEDMEIVSVTGNVGRMDGKPIIHAHGVFANLKLQTYGGHIKKLIVSATCEVTLTKLDGEIIRDFDEATGLNLLK